jgi:hypothetical protein
MGYKPGMPIDGFRRPELQAEYVVSHELARIPSETYKELSVFLNPFQIYAAQDLVKKPDQLPHPQLMKKSFNRYPIYFFFKQLTPLQKKSWNRVCRYFSRETLENFFSNANDHIGIAITDEFIKKDNTFRLISGLDQLEAVLSDRNRIRAILGTLEMKKRELLSERTKLAEEVKAKYQLEIPELEEIAYLYGKPNIAELTQMFFDFPNYFVGTEYCEHCNKKLSNWLSITKGSGPICGKHNYEIDLAGSSPEEITTYICDLIERKYELMQIVPVTPNSDLLKYRKARISRSFLGRRHNDKNVFSDRNLSESIVGPTLFKWKEFVADRVFKEYLI